MSFHKEKKKTILFGIDGATFSIIDKFRDQLPTFDYVMKGGSRTTLLSTIPAVTVPAWTSMFTGVNPGKHGITDFILNLNGKFTMGTSNYRMVDTIWNIVGKKGLKSIVVNDPATYPPDKVNGIMTTGLMTPPGAEYVFPGEMKAELERVAGGYWTDLPLEYYFTVNKDHEKAYSMIEQFANKTANVGRYLARNHEWDILAVIFVSTDKIQHTLWHKEEYILKHYRQIDSIMKDFLDMANTENANLLIASDHGFGPLRKTFYINTWLASIGLQNRKQDAMSLMTKIGLTPSRIAVVLKKLHLYNIVLRKLIQSERIVDAAFQYDRPIDLYSSAAFAKAEGIFLNHDVSSDSYEETRKIIIEKLGSLVDKDIPVVSKIYKREEVMHGPYTGRAPDIMFILNDGYCPTYYSDGPDSEYLGNDKGGYKGGTVNTGIHRPEGIFIGYGPDIRKNGTMKEARVWDITPTMLHMMGLPVPSYMDGLVMKDIFETEFAKRVILRETDNEVERIKSRLRHLKGSRDKD